MTTTPEARTEADRKIIREAFDRWHEGTGAITDVFAPGMVWRIEGHCWRRSSTRTSSSSSTRS